jgi:hypothetical protein
MNVIFFLKLSYKYKIISNLKSALTIIQIFFMFQNNISLIPPLIILRLVRIIIIKWY